MLAVATVLTGNDQTDERPDKMASVDRTSLDSSPSAHRPAYLLHIGP